VLAGRDGIVGAGLARAVRWRCGIVAITFLAIGQPHAAVQLNEYGQWVEARPTKAKRALTASVDCVTTAVDEVEKRLKDYVYKKTGHFAVKAK
jgi:hypothetical protein